jgi:hypothetical protein
LFGYLVCPAHGDGPEAMDFEVLDPYIFVVSNPTDSPKDWKYTSRKLDFGRTGLWFCTAYLFVDDYVYLYGHRKAKDEGYDKAKTCLARILTEDLRNENYDGKFEYFAADRTWSNSSESLAETWHPAITEASVLYHEKTQLYIATTYFPADPHMRIVTAPAPEGPWSEAHVVWTDPDHEANPEFYSYTFRLHPHLFEGDEMVATYVINTPQLATLFDHPEYYYPRFLRIRIEN